MNILGPLFVTGLYAYTVFGFVRNPSVNDIVPYHFVNPKALFYAWIILSVFLLDWAKSGIAGFEAAALMKPALAPKSAMQLMWHLDRGWGSLSGWWKIVGTISKYTGDHLAAKHHGTLRRWRGPGILWFYPATSSLLFYIAVPLAGISIDPKDSFKLSKRQIIMLGVNETTFDVRTNAAVQGLASNSWRTGQPTTPKSPAIFYAKDGTRNASSTFYEDFIQDIYARDVLGQETADRTVTFFSGPPIAERAHGKAWGLLSSVSCSTTALDQLKLVGNVTGPNDWTTFLGGLFSGKLFTAYANDNWTVDPMDTAGIDPVFRFADVSFGIDFQYVIATDTDGWLLDGTDWAPGNGHYSNTALYSLPNKGSFEVVVWQSIDTGRTPDENFRNMSTNPLVTAFKNGTNLCFGVQCTVESNVGFAKLDAAKRTYSNFEQRPANLSHIDLTTAYEIGTPIMEYPGVFSLQSIVFGALSTVSMGYMGAPSCMPGTDKICNAFYGANLATGMVPTFGHLDPKALNSKYTTTGTLLQIPSISPERMTLAMYKIFGEAAAAMMSIGPANWTGELHGLDPASDLVPGKIPWQIVLTLLCLWCAMTVIPQIWTFREPRWSSTLEAFEIFRFGAEWRDAIQQFKSNDFRDNDVLLDMPGMIGDMTPNAGNGFIGLTRIPAPPGRSYAKAKDE